MGNHGMMLEASDVTPFLLIVSKTRQLHVHTLGKTFYISLTPLCA